MDAVEPFTCRMCALCLLLQLAGLLELKVYTARHVDFCSSCHVRVADHFPRFLAATQDGNGKQVPWDEAPS